MALENRVQIIDARLDRASIVVRDLDPRIRDVKRHTGIGATIAEVEAAEIAIAVKAVGQRLVATNQRDGYAKVYSKLYQGYRVSRVYLDTFKRSPLAVLRANPSKYFTCPKR